MTTEWAQAALDEIAKAFSDFRNQVCRLETTRADEHTLAVKGEVLDAATRDSVQHHLEQRFPSHAIDLSELTVLSAGEPAFLTVATNLTSLHREPSWLAEQLSQLFNGWKLEILAQRERWCFVRQEDGYLGWAYRAYLSETPAPEPSHIVCEPVSLLRDAPDSFAHIASRVLGGTGVRPVAVEGAWARLEMPGNLCGWLPLAHLRSMPEAPKDEISLRNQLISDARHWIGTPYLWGGCSANGIDCSGLAQLIYRLSGIILPRDADQQYQAGKVVEAPFLPGDLLFFGDGSDWRSITHVGMSLGGWNIIHSSRSNNGVYLDDVQAVPHLKESFQAARTFVAE